MFLDFWQLFNNSVAFQWEIFSILQAHSGQTYAPVSSRMLNFTSGSNKTDLKRKFNSIGKFKSLLLVLSTLKVTTATSSTAHVVRSVSLVGYCLSNRSYA